MPRFLVLPENLKNNQFTLIGSEAHHASRVMRLKAGDSIDLFDGKDASFKGKITHIDEGRVEGEILSSRITSSSTGVSLILYQALIKATKWDWLVEKACEVGVTRLVPIVTARTLIKPTHDRALDRWKRIAVEASKQCGRSAVMDVRPAISFDNAIQEGPCDALSLIPWEKENSTSVREACQGFQGNTFRVFIGPEGGWEPGEIYRALLQAIKPVRLGPTLLRSETAGIVASALVLSEGGLYA